ncbi:MAG: sigma 54-interacting transcriptional regulator [Tissierellia bacterium]|nr:sigma 54-interacting transcriptional regulator [Tissierellia bacterium]
MKDYKTQIAKSKERCRKLGLKKEQIYSKKIISDADLQKILVKNRNMIMTALPYIEEIIKFTKGSDFFIFLTDSEGCILNALGDEKILSEAFSLKMIPGAYMNEENVGTNAMSYVIKTGDPVQLTGEDHYIDAYSRWTCSAAPIRDHKGELIGVLDLTGYTKNVHPHTLGIVVAAAKAIEEMIKNKGQNEYKIAKRVLNIINEGIIFTDEDGNIKMYNDTAAEMLGKDNKFISDNINQLIDDWHQIKSMLNINKSFSKNVCIASLNDNCLFNLEVKKIYFEPEDSFEIVHIFKEIDRVHTNVINNYGYCFDKIIGEDDNFVKIVEYAKKIADSNSTILIMGESGTGKELFAQSIHNYSSRRNYPLIAINCGAIPEQLIESELFGYEDGAFTGAKKGGNPGKFELADGGTILLDEIGEMPLDMQVKLLRVLEEGFITRLGGKRTIPVDVRIIASTNKDLEKEVESGKFRKDLYYRLNVLPLYVPPLRDRKSDIRILTDYFMNKISKDLNKNTVHISEENLELMERYDWPGNIRELQNVIELMINTEIFPTRYFTKREQYMSSDGREENFDIESVEKEHLIRVIRRCNGNITHSADMLGIRRNTLYNKIKKYNINI